jgi:Flp pilus assembly protein TadG
MKNFLSDTSGAVLIEAAIAFPVLIAVLLGMVEFGEAYTVSRKNAQVAASVADIVAQQFKVTTSQLNDIAKIQGTILEPYSTTPTGLRVSSIILKNGNASNNAAVQWSVKWGNLSALPTAGGNLTNFTLPTGLIAQDSTIIVAESSYNFTPAIGSYLTGGVTFNSKAYYMPRVTAITCCS